MFRRILLIACGLLFVSAAPASAQSYSNVLGTGQQRTPTVNIASTGRDPASVLGSTVTTGEGTLPRTGSNRVLPLTEGATVLLGAGALSVLVARRRRTASSPFPA